MMQAISIRRLSLVSLILISSIWTSVSAAVVVPDGASPPTQQQLQFLLSGNSTRGNWAGRSYLQYFSKSGSTDYQEAGEAKSVGSWRVNAKGQYCSIWPPSSREICYQVRVLDRSIYWQSGDDFYPSQVVDGNIFNQ